MIRTCIQCSKEFSYEGTKDRKLCSRQCSGQFRKLPDRLCEGCGSTMDGRNSRRFCSKKCVWKLNSKVAADRANVSDGTKQCRSCREQKPYSDFDSQKLGIGGVRSTCKPCMLIYRKNARDTNPMVKEASRRGSRKSSYTTEGRLRKSAHNKKKRQENPVHFMWLASKNRAKKKRLEFTISEQDIVLPEFCPVFGTKMSVGEGSFLMRRGGGESDSYSLDRIDNDLGYVPGNVAVISWRANRLKANSSISDLEKIIAWMKSQKANLPAQQPESQQAA